MQHKFLRAVSSLTISSLSSLQLFQLIRYGTLVLAGVGFAKLHLPLSDIGHFETFVMLSGMVSFFWVSGVINSTLSVYPKKNEKEQKELLFSSFISLFVLSVVAIGGLMLFSNNLLSFLDKREEGQIVPLSMFYILFNCPSLITEYILYLHNRKSEIIYYALTSSVLTLFLVLSPVILGYSIEYSVVGLIVVAALKLVLALLLLKKFAVFNLNLKLLLLNLKLSVPLMLSLFVSGSAEYIDGIIVKSTFDDVSFAIFRYGAKELPVLLIIANTMSTAMIPSIADNLTEGLGELKRKSTQLMHFFFPLTMLLMLVSPYLYKYAFNESFLYSAFIFNIYLLLIIPRILFPQTILTALKQTKFLLASSLIEITLNVLLSIWLAGKIGLAGIAIGSFVAYSADKLFLVSVNYYVNRISPTQYLKSSTFCLYSIGCCITFIAAYILIQNGI